jgi:hypothetical protein
MYDLSNITNVWFRRGVITLIMLGIVPTMVIVAVAQTVWEIAKAAVPIVREEFVYARGVVVDFISTMKDTW